MCTQRWGKYGGESCQEKLLAGVLSCEQTDARGNLVSGARSTKGEARSQAGDSFVRGLLTVEVSEDEQKVKA